MSKATLKFNLDEQEDSIRFEQAVKARDAFVVLAEVDRTLRNSVKYGSFNGTTLTPEQVDILEHVRNWFNSELADLDIGRLTLS